MTDIIIVCAGSVAVEVYYEILAINEKAKAEGLSPAWVRIMMQRAKEMYRRQKEALDREYKKVSRKGGVL